jgi:crotonobetainyl-CoA:carnitine CoA-transferase CaiB-like acyl-CoA transferase
MKYALENVRVVELGGYIVGSLCGSILADMGADVIKIEPFGGDGLRGPSGAFQCWNRGARGMALDLKTKGGKKILHQLAERADVLVQNLRQGVAERWEADYDTLSKLNPRLIYLAMPGYGQSGPYVEKPAFDPLLQALSGAAHAQGGEGIPPVYLRSSICDNAGAMLGAWGVAMALYQRTKTRKGQFLHGSLLNSAIAVQSGEFLHYDGKPPEPPCSQRGRNALHSLYKTQDGWLFIECDGKKCWQGLCQVAGNSSLSSDPRFASAEARLENDEALREVFDSVFLGRTTADWLGRLQAVGIPCTNVNGSRTLFDEAQMLANDLISEHESADVGKLQQAGLMIKLSETPGNLVRAAPGLGQHNIEILVELGYGTDQIQSLKEEGAIL